MAKSTTIVLTTRAKPKGRPRFNGRIAYTDSATRDFENTVKMQLKKGFTFDEPFSGPLQVTMSFCFRKPKSTKFSYPPKGDCDNFFKSVSDAANGIIWNDDSQIVCMMATKRWADNDSITLVVTEFDE